jgi:hypothetical protein
MMNETVFPLDALEECHEIASKIALKFPDLCGRLHMLADVMEQTIAWLAAPVAVQGSGAELESPRRARRNGKDKGGPKVCRKPASGKACPHCGQTFNPRGLHRHVKACKGTAALDALVAGD